MMTKEDFRVGQTVYILQVLNCARSSTLEERIKEVKVLSVGRKYITVDYWRKMRFDVTNNFREDTIYTPNYSLYLSKEQIFEQVKRNAMEAEVNGAFRWVTRLTHKMTMEDLKVVLDIVHKYKDGEGNG